MKSILFEFVSTRIKHTGKYNWKEKITEAIHTAFKVRFQREWFIRNWKWLAKDIVLKAGSKNKN